MTVLIQSKTFGFKKQLLTWVDKPHVKAGGCQVQSWGMCAGGTGTSQVQPLGKHCSLRLTHLATESGALCKTLQTPDEGHCLRWPQVTEMSCTWNVFMNWPHLKHNVQEGTAGAGRHLAFCVSPVKDYTVKAETGWSVNVMGTIYCFVFRMCIFYDLSLFKIIEII